MGKVLAVCISEQKGTQKKNVGSAVFVEDWGLEGDAHAGKWHRQVSLLSGEKIDAFRAKGAEVEDGAFGENLVVEGIDFAKLPVGTRFRCGEVVLELTQIGKECHNGCAIFQKMGECIMPREGVFTRVLKGGKVSVGDEMTVDKAMIFDTHAHYDDEAFDEDRFAMLDSMQENGIGHIVDVCASVGHFDRVYDLVEKYPFVYGAVGVHPDDADKVDAAVLDEIRRYCDMKKTVAVGEIGLDYAGTVGREAQLRIFREQLDWAERLGKPVVLHCVKAFEAVMRELAPHALRAVIFHGFIGSSQQAAEAIKKGYYLSFGERTFRSPRTVEALRRTPVENLFAETDESDVPIEEIYRRIAQAKDLDPELLKCAIYRNYREIFER